MNKLSLFCRLCLDILPQNGRISLFQSHHDPSLADMVLYCTSVSMRKGDILPQEMCGRCAERLEECYVFRNQVRDADKLLRKTIKKLAAEPVEKIVQSLKQRLNITNPEPLVVEVKVEGEEGESAAAPTETSSPNEPFPELEQPVITYVKEEPEDIPKVLFASESLQNLETKKTSDGEVHEDQLARPKLKSYYSIRRAKRRQKQTEMLEKTDVSDTDKSFTCKFCNKRYPSVGGYRYHVHTVHSTSYQPHICDICGKSFKTKKNLEVHKNSVHFGIKQNLCDACGKGFATKYALSVHKVWHSGEKNFTCEVCAAKFSSLGKLNTHAAIHGGPKKFMCEICSRELRWKKDFEIHMRTHTGEKPFSCSICGKAFSSMTNMKKHETSHTGTQAKMAAAVVSSLPVAQPLFKPSVGRFSIGFGHT